jgi:hypothetical protein
MDGVIYGDRAHSVSNTDRGGSVVAVLTTAATAAVPTVFSIAGIYDTSIWRISRSRLAGNTAQQSPVLHVAQLRFCDVFSLRQIGKCQNVAYGEQ